MQGPGSWALAWCWGSGGKAGRQWVLARMDVMRINMLLHSAVMQKSGSTLFLSPGEGSWEGWAFLLDATGLWQWKIPRRGPCAMARPRLHLCCVGPHLLTRTDHLSEPLGKQLIKLCNVPGRLAGDVPVLQHLPEPALGQDLPTVPRDRGSCPASPYSIVLLVLVLVG